MEKIRCFSFVLLLFSLPLFACCNKTDEGDRTQEKARMVYQRFSAISTNCESGPEAFLYFTDPHLLSYGNRFDESIKNQLVSSFDLAKEVYKMLPLNFVLCGGDWLIDSDTQEIAKQKLLFADKQMKSMFTPYYKMFGNHDTNYQGIISDDNKNRGDFPREFIDKEYFSETGSAYYSFVEGNTEFFVLDSGIDWNPALNDYRREQLKWLSNELEKSDRLHKAIGIHLFYNDGIKITPMAEELMSICSAFNSRTKYIIDDDEYDFSHSRGVIHFVISGHSHVDFTERVKGIPVIGTTNFYRGTHPFDICILDYNTGYLDMVRVGEGEDRHVEMYMNK